MGTRKTGLVFVGIMLALLMSMSTLAFKILPLKTQPRPIVSVYPPVSTALVNETFAINITVTDVVITPNCSGLYGWEAWMTFGPQVINAVNATEGPFLKAVGNETLWLPVKINNTEGTVKVGAMISPFPSFPPTGAVGNGTLATVTFEVMSEGATTIHFEENTRLYTVIDDDVEEIAHTVEDGYFITPLKFMIEHVSPQSAPVGTSVYVSGIGATPNGEVRIYLDETNVANTTAENWSRWSASFEVPDVNLGDYTIMALDVTTNTTDTASFTVRTPRPWTVDDDGPADFHTIQEAINVANPGDTIYVHNGTYYENIIVNKILTLIGENKDATIIDGGALWETTVVKVTANNVIFRGFTTRVSGVFSIHILLNETANTVIADNNIIGVAVPEISGIRVDTSTNITLTGNNITVCRSGVVLSNSSYVHVTENNIGKGLIGIVLYKSFNNTVSDNNLTEIKSLAISLSESSNNTIAGNSIANNWYGIRLYYSSSNTIYHNNVINNTVQTYIYPSYPNVWDDGYPSGGNYWSNYTGVDLYSGLFQDETGSDGIGDTPHVIYGSNTDNYPLMAPINTFDAGIWDETPCYINMVSNSTISNFQINIPDKTIRFNVTGETSLGFCRVTIPKVIVEEMWQGNYTVLVNGETVEFRNWTDSTQTYIYFTYQHSMHEVIIVPESPSAIILPTLMILTILAVALRKKMDAHR